jgi:putative hemolysin
MDTFLDILSQAWPWALALAGALVAGLANGVETGLYRLNRIRLRLRADSGDRRAKILQELLGDLGGMIIVSLIATSGGAYLATAMATMLITSSGWVSTNTGIEIATTLVVTPLMFVFADVVPKSLFVAEADHWLYLLARPLEWCYVALKRTGVVPALNGLSRLILRVARRQESEGADPFHPRQRLRTVLAESAAEGVISGYQHELVTKVLALREKLVGDVMIPLGRVAAVPVTIDRPDFLEHLRRHSYSRLPVFDGRRENIVGIVHIIDVLAAKADSAPLDLEAVISCDVVSVPADMTVSQAIFRMRKARAAMAIVSSAETAAGRSGKGGAVGIITVKDLVEEIVGELAAW